MPLTQLNWVLLGTATGIYAAMNITILQGYRVPVCKQLEHKMFHLLRTYVDYNTTFVFHFRLCVTKWGADTGISDRT
jgi:hypothetical protein